MSIAFTRGHYFIVEVGTVRWVDTVIGALSMLPMTSMYAHAESNFHQRLL